MGFVCEEEGEHLGHGGAEVRVATSLLIRLLEMGEVNGHDETGFSRACGTLEDK